MARKQTIPVRSHTAVRDRLFQQMVKDWEQSLRDLEQAFGIGITVHDPYGRFCTASGDFILPGRNLHPHAICARKKSNPGDSKRCVTYCQHQIQQQMEEAPQSFVSECWKGVSEVVVPILCRKRLVLILFAGPFGQNGDLPPLTRKAQQTLTRLLRLCGSGIWAQMEEWLQEYPGTEDSRTQQIRRFLDDHSHESVTLENLAAELFLSPSRTGHLVTELFGKTFRQLLTDERIRRAKTLLQTTALSLQTIAARTGFATPYYFSRVFHEQTGKTPSAFKQQHARHR